MHDECESFFLSACHCDFCQKRTGSVFGVEAYFREREGIKISVETKVYNGLEIDGVGSVAGVDISNHFCPTCGSTVFWTITGHPVLGIAVGKFVDPDFPAPTMETSTAMHHHWVSPIPSAEQFDGYPTESDAW